MSVKKELELKKIRLSLEIGSKVGLLKKKRQSFIVTGVRGRGRGYELMIKIYSHEGLIHDKAMNTNEAMNEAMNTNEAMRL